MSLAHSNFQSKSSRNSLKPREKATQFGITNLSIAELLALILGSGTRKQSVFTLAKKLAPMVSLGTLSDEDLSKIEIGQNQILKLQAVLELANRITNRLRPTINTPTDIWHCCLELCQYKQEYVVALYLDGRHRLIKKQTLAVGGHNFALLEPITLLHHAFLLPSACCVLVHNHPSGDPQPSTDDVSVTARLYAACELTGIQLLDHVIICKNRFSSMKELGVLPAG